MPIKQIEKAFDDYEIRNTATHNSSVIDNGAFTIKTLIIENGHNQTATFQCQGSLDGVNNWFLIGGEWDVTATTYTFQTCDSYIPYWRIQATCGTAPTTGDLTVAICRVG